MDREAWREKLEGALADAEGITPARLNSFAEANAWLDFVTRLRSEIAKLNAARDAGLRESGTR